ncbi:hypothetical protein [Teredinibacter sp. KSP-S5-2]|uniref:hypothetical protein n=1 Tax=Teredinibacter sp. KSP-S5-2 TaxID=3034506 RepID=UPI00293495A6|nr:hypothetical protein [Teredinibacter sp. KSP-S5-2]WNO10607.1 hypothetical protein P5V12_05410 [Teredinibacter sp. KSP-S5-2]
MAEDESNRNMIKLKSAEIYWNPDDSKINSILSNGEVEIENMNKEDIEYLVKELDRRLCQLWDKVAFERDNGLVDYSKFNSCCKDNSK